MNHIKRKILWFLFVLLLSVPIVWSDNYLCHICDLGCEENPEVCRGDYPFLCQRSALFGETGEFCVAKGFDWGCCGGRNDIGLLHNCELGALSREELDEKYDGDCDPRTPEMQSCGEDEYCCLRYLGSDSGCVKKQGSVSTIWFTIEGVADPDAVEDVKGCDSIITWQVQENCVGEWKDISDTCEETMDQGGYGSIYVKVDSGETLKVSCTSEEIPSGSTGEHCVNVTWCGKSKLVKYGSKVVVDDLDQGVEDNECPEFFTLMYFNQQDADGCDDRIDTNCVGRDDDPGDSACCTSDRHCVFNGECFFDMGGDDRSRLKDIDGDGVAGEFCYQGQWVDLDEYNLACERKGFRHVKSGDPDLGEYQDTETDECCGDDTDEVYLDVNGFTLCCPEGSDWIDSEGRCAVLEEIVIECDSCDSCTNAIKESSNSVNKRTVFLTADIDDVEGTCIRFDDASNVPLDCQGHHVNGLGAAGSSGIHVSGSGGNLVRNCKISGFDYGIYLESSRDNVFLNAELRDNGEGMRLVDVHDTKVEDSLISGNELNGIYVEGSGNLIEDSVLTKNNLGVSIAENSKSNQLLGNNVCDNREEDIYSLSGDNGGFGNRCDALSDDPLNMWMDGTIPLERASGGERCSFSCGEGDMSIDVLIIAIRQNMLERGTEEGVEAVYTEDQLSALEDKIGEYIETLQDTELPEDKLTAEFFYLDGDKTLEYIGSRVENPVDPKEIDGILDQLIYKTGAEYVIIVGGAARFPHTVLADSWSDYGRANSDALYADFDRDSRFLPDVSVGRFPDPNQGDMDVIMNLLETSINLHNGGGLNFLDQYTLAPDGLNDEKIRNLLQCTCTHLYGTKFQSGLCSIQPDPSEFSGHDLLIVASHGTPGMFDETNPGIYEPQKFKGEGFEFLPSDVSSIDVQDSVWVLIPCFGGLIDNKEKTEDSIILEFFKQGGAIALGSTDANSGYGRCEYDCRVNNYEVPGGDCCIGSLYMEVLDRSIKDTRIGDAYIAGKIAYSNYVYAHGCDCTYDYDGTFPVIEQLHINNFYGDPTLKINAGLETYTPEGNTQTFECPDGKIHKAIDVADDDSCDDPPDCPRTSYSLDSACCAEDECVFKGGCFFDGAYVDMSGDGVTDYICLRGEYWADVDMGESYCIGAGFAWCESGEAGVFGEYKSFGDMECCGDDAGEVYVEKVLDSGETVSRCCAEGNNELDVDGNCISQMNHPPIAEALAGFTRSEAKQTASLRLDEGMRFFGSGSKDPDGSIVSYKWEFGDGESYEGTDGDTSHVYVGSGMYTAKLTVRDDKNAEVESEPVTVTVHALPTAVARVGRSVDDLREGEITIRPGENVTLDASASTSPNGEITGYWWIDFESEDNIYNFVKNSRQLEIQYKLVGVYRVHLWVEDETGSTGYDNVTIRVEEDPAKKPPEAKILCSDNEVMLADLKVMGVSFTELDVSCGSTIFFDASLSSPEEEIVKYKWDFGDGQSAEGVKTSHVFNCDIYKTNSVTVKLYVYDVNDQGRMSTVEIDLSGAYEERYHPGILAGTNLNALWSGEFIGPPEGKRVYFKAAGLGDYAETLSYQWMEVDAHGNLKNIIGQADIMSQKFRAGTHYIQLRVYDSYLNYGIGYVTLLVSPEEEDIEAGFRMLFIPFDWEGGMDAFDPKIQEYVNTVREVFPLRECPEKITSVSSYDICDVGMPTGSTAECEAYDAEFSRLLQSCAENTGLEYDFLVGVTNHEVCKGIEGRSLRNTDIVWVEMADPFILAHEMGHKFGLNDEYYNYCGCREVSGPNCLKEELDGDDSIWPGFEAYCAGGSECEMGMSLCKGNRNDAGGRCIMSSMSEDSLRPQEFCPECMAHLKSIPQLNCNGVAEND